MISLCNQIPQRSFLWLWDPPLLCARCTGFYFAILVALTFSTLRPQRAKIFSSPAITAALVAATAIAIEKTLDLELGNWGRFLTALPIGFAVGLGLAMPFVSRRYQEEIS